MEARIICPNTFGDKNLDLTKVLVNFIKKFGQRKCQPFPLEDLLYANSSLFTKILVYDRYDLWNSFAKLQENSLGKCRYVGKK